jgi:protein arginine kinase
MQLSELIRNAGSWLTGKGPETDIIISSRIRLARNLEGRKFLCRASESEKAEIERYLHEGLADLPMRDATYYFRLHELDSTDRLLLVERHLVSKEHASGSGPRGVFVSQNECAAVMTNEEDHLRIQVLHPGLQLEQTWLEINDLDTEIEKRVNYAFSPRFGYLTCCPTNVGTGMRASVMLHLPALVMTKQITKVFDSVSKIGLTVRGLYGEGTYASGDFYQISNQLTLGKTEMAIVENIGSVVPQIVRYERTVRDTLLAQSKALLEDRVWRAYGLLEKARVISSEETLDLLSAVRLGVNVGIIDNLDIGLVNVLLIMTQPAHLQKIYDKKLDVASRDQARADFIREKLSGSDTSKSSGGN